MSYETDLPENIEMEGVAKFLDKKKAPLSECLSVSGGTNLLMRNSIFLLVNYYPIDIFNI
jgi:hypothetical protein